MNQTPSAVELMVLLFFSSGSDMQESDEGSNLRFDIRQDISATDIASALVMLKKQHRLRSNVWMISSAY